MNFNQEWFNYVMELQKKAQEFAKNQNWPQEAMKNMNYNQEWINYALELQKKRNT